MTISDSRCTAHHEAAHAVIYLHFGIEVEMVTLWPCQDGCCTISSELPPTNGRLFAILAGAEADKRFLAGDPEMLSKRNDGWKIDLERAEQILKDLGRAGQLEAAVAEAAKLVSEQWHIIRSLAQRWIEISEENYSEGDTHYCTQGSEVKRLVEYFRAGSSTGQVQAFASHCP